MTGYSQDLPPKGGFAPIQYTRNLPSRGPSGAVIFTLVAAFCGFGFWRVIEGNLEKQELAREKRWSRINLIPFLLAENDRDTYRREFAIAAREEQVNAETKPVYSDKAKYTPKSFVLL